ncbi:hypothetical protein AVEN_99271-1, partial [Araneus ventricosus]
KQRNIFRKISKCDLLLRHNDDDSFFQTNDNKLEEKRSSASDYPRDHFLFNESNKKKIGCFKDELHSKPIFETNIGLRPKIYSIKSERGEKKTAKGVARSVVERNIRHEGYRRCREELKSTREIQHRIQSENHKLKTVKVNKIALCAFDDKRYLLDDNVHTLAYGHYKI